MSSVDPYINIIIALLGLAYPVLLQVVARLDERYESGNVTSLFKIEREWKLFRYMLIISLATVLIWSLKLKPIVNISSVDFIINNSAILLLGISTIILITSFLAFVKKVTDYYTLYSLIPYLIECHKKSNNKILYIPAISDLLLLTIRKQQTNLSRTLSNFFYEEFKRIRDDYNNEAVVYPVMYYEVVYRAIEELAIIKEKRNYSLERRTSGEIWLLGELQHKEISSETYMWMWRNILLAIRYQQDDLIINHWETCHQYFSYALSSIYKEYNYSPNGLDIINEDAVNKRTLERQQFIEFHYALGGLLVYRGRYHCLKQLFSYTQSQPPKYELLPESMYEIFRFYFDVSDPYERKYTWISSQYSFPNLNGINADGVIKRWIMSYMTILFLRQYALAPYLIKMRPLDFPSSPSTQSEIKQWINGLDSFKEMVVKNLHNVELIKTLSLDFITPEWCEKKGKLYPILFLDTFKVKLENDYNENLFNMPISSDKVEKYKNSTRSIIESMFKKIQRVNSNTMLQGDDHDIWYTKGQSTFQNKDTFSENPESHHENFDSFLASDISRNMLNGFSEILSFKVSSSYLLNKDLFFDSIDKITTKGDFTIINFGIDLGCFDDQLSTNQLSNGKYKSFNIFTFDNTDNVKNSFFIIKNIDLPSVSTKLIDERIIENYNLSKISDVINLYASVVDCNDLSSEIYEECKQNMSEEDLKKFVLLSIYILTEFKWKKNIKLIQLKLYSKYVQDGILNKLNEIKSIDGEFSSEE